MGNDMEELYKRRLAASEQDLKQVESACQERITSTQKAAHLAQAEIRDAMKLTEIQNQVSCPSQKEFLHCKVAQQVRFYLGKNLDS